MKKNSIPVIYYHSVADHEKQHPWAFLSVRIGVFKAQMKLLKILGYNTCNWGEFYEHSQGIKHLPKKTVFIHFDDGFLDNWTVVYPIMEKYNFKYSILITPDFIEKSEEIRGFITKTKHNNEQDWWGYLSEGEVKKMSASGLVDFQCHGYTHTWFESSEEILDFYDGEKFLPHLNWNLNPELKPFWLTKMSDMKVPLGFPVFEYKKSLELQKAFILNEDFVKACLQNANEGKDTLRKIYESYKSTNKLGIWETTEESQTRFEKELVQTREYIASLTKQESDYIVFPGGGNQPNIIQLTKELGFKIVSKGKGLNFFNSKKYQMTRYAGFHDFKTLVFNGLLNVLFLYLQLLRGRGSKLVKMIIKRYQNV